METTEVGAMRRVMKKLVLVNLLIASLVGTPVFAASLQSIMENVKTPMMATSTRGVINSINLDNRTAIIGGLKYQFGPPEFPVKVTLLNSVPGSIQMLRPGMKVRVLYGALESYRIVGAIQQLPKSARVEN